MRKFLFLAIMATAALALAQAGSDFYGVGLWPDKSVPEPYATSTIDSGLQLAKQTISFEAAIPLVHDQANAAGAKLLTFAKGESFVVLGATAKFEAVSPDAAKAGDVSWGLGTTVAATNELQASHYDIVGVHAFSIGTDAITNTIYGVASTPTVIDNRSGDAAICFNLAVGSGQFNAESTNTVKGAVTLFLLKMER